MGTAVTQVLRPGGGKPVMGRSIRTERWRYTEWGEGGSGRELYDHSADPHEFTNLADREEFAKVIGELRRALAKKAEGTVPKTPFNPPRL